MTRRSRLRTLLDDSLVEFSLCRTLDTWNMRAHKGIHGWLSEVLLNH